MKRIILILALAALAFVSIRCAKKDTGSSFRPVRLERGNIAVEIRETGTVSPRNRLEIKPPVPGRIEEVFVAEGDRVKKGQVLARLSSTDRAALLDAARAKGESEVKKWEDIYRPTSIIAPLDGFIIVRGKEPGQTVGSSDVLLVMADTLIVESDVDETDLRYIKLGQKVSLFLDAYPDLKFDGVVEHIAFESQLINNVTVFAVKIRPLNVPPQFRAGMTSTIEVQANPRENVLLLPVDAVTSAGGAPTVLVRAGEGKPEKRRITTGVTNGKQIEIVSGLSDEDVVLTAGKTGKRENRSNQRFGGIPGMGGGRH